MGIFNKQNGNDVVKTPMEKLNELFDLYTKTHNQKYLKQMNDLPLDEIVDEYIRKQESFKFGLAKGVDYAWEKVYSPFNKFLDQNFGKYRDQELRGYDDLEQYIKECSDSFVNAFELAYPQTLSNDEVRSNIKSHTAEIISFFIVFHGYNKGEYTQDGAVSLLGFNVRHTSFKSIAEGYLWMFKENPTYYLDDFLEIYNTRVMNYIEKDIMFRTKPYSELTPLDELDFSEGIVEAEEDAITQLTEGIYNNDRIIRSMQRNSDGHFINMLEQRLSSNKNTGSDRSAISITMILLEDESSRIIMDYRGGFPNIPEIMVQAPQVCGEIFDNLKEETDSIDQFAFLTPLWCAYAGMGAVAMWNDDWPKLRDKGIVESLIEERGYFAMDEFVTDYIGVGWDTDESKSIRSVLNSFSHYILDQALIDDETVDMPYYFEALKAMYMYGMIYEMSRLGMH